ncbi:heparinase II/III family protein [Bacteroidota bacterium]|nr:heparinase II/III family protein [Bacteroidota bacterium]
MDFLRLKLFINTVKYLKAKQVFYRLYYSLKKRVLKNYNRKEIPLTYLPIIWQNSINNYTSFDISSLKFNFLNISHFFYDDINWNYESYGKLWTYNLNYFDFLNQDNISREDGLLLVRDFVKKKDSIIDGSEPYPISLRCINWVKFLSINNVRDREIDDVLYNDLIFLSKNLEYHLLGNHLLENAFSLLFGSYYFQNKKLYRKSIKLLKEELNEQILADGAHFELSPMYHQILFFRLLDCINLIKLNNFWIKDDLLIFLKNKASLMYSWLESITYQNGDIPMVNDSTYNIAPTSKKLFNYAKKMGILNISKALSDSGYRKITSKKYELFIDVGNIGPDYQPGHSHSDTFNFELHINKSPFFVDTGISTYEKNTVRQNERGTKSHNTIMVNEKEQTETWGGFRVGRRARVNITKENDFKIEAQHDGYKCIGINHKRTFKWNIDDIEIKDSLNKDARAKALFHLHSKVLKPVANYNELIFKEIGVHMSFQNHSKIEIQPYNLSKGFNTTKSALLISVSFNKKLTTKIRV